jgi:hypothetical protein
MFNAVRFKKGDTGTKAILTGPWNEKVHRDLIDRRPNELVLNSSFGWRGTNIDFVQDYSWLKSISILNFRTEDVSAVHGLRELSQLEIITYCKTKLDFAAFPHLKVCSLEWRSSAMSLFECVTLEKLFLNRYKGHSSEPFGQLINLKELSILNGPIREIVSLQKLQQLESLRLAGLSKLNSLEGVEVLSTLRHLEIDGCRGISNVEPLSQLQGLKLLEISDMGTIASLYSLRELTGLQKLLFPGSTNIVDGDLSVLSSLKNLRVIAFQNRRHYSHRCEDFKRY